MISRKLTLTNVLIALLITCCSLLIYWQITQHDFVNFDDGSHVTMNASVRGGMTWHGLIETISVSDQYTYWHPLTWISHMLDCEMFGLNPGMHHLVSLIFHVASSVILFVVLRRMTGMVWHSAFVALVFALHPISVESVSWIAARKTVLSTFFWMLTMLVYSYYVERPRISRYLLLLVIFVLGLLAKPMLITLPFVLLLLDYWPLERFRLGGVREKGGTTVRARNEIKPSLLVLEKVPLILLSILSILVSIMSQRSSMVSYELIPMDLRIANALVSYVQYIGKLLYPVDLAVFYPFPESGIPSWQVIGASILLLVITVTVLIQLKKRPYLAVGWFWFTGTLVPVSGLVQNGNWPAMADRWAYVPCIGLFVMIAWGASEIIPRWRLRNIVISGGAACIIIFLATLSFHQIQYWKNSISLFAHTVTVTKNNKLAYNNLGAAYGDNGEFELAIRNLSKAITLDPDYIKAQFNMGVVLQKAGLFDEAAIHYLQVTRLKPNYFDAYNNLGTVLYYGGHIDDAIEQFNKAIEINPGHTFIRNNLGIAYLRKGMLSEAAEQFEMVIQLDPGNSLARNNLQSIRLLQEQSQN